MQTLIKKPKSHKFRCGDVLHVFEHKITPGRLRQISSQHGIGLVIPDFLPVDGSPPPKSTRWYSGADIMKLVTLCTRLRKLTSDGRLNISENLKKIS